ncbi:MAG: hypothetical protein DWI23_03455, partial [Planctomycetota bacterium]
PCNGRSKCAFKSVEWQQRGDAAGLCRVGQLVKNSENPKIIREGMGLACPHAAALVVFKASNLLGDSVQYRCRFGILILGNQAAEQAERAGR